MKRLFVMYRSGLTKEQAAKELVDIARDIKRGITGGSWTNCDWEASE